MFESILVPLDGSVLAESALPHAVAIAQAYGSRVCLMRVIQPAEDAFDRPVNVLDWEIAKNEAGSYLAHWRDRLRSVGIACDTALQEGDAAVRVVEFMNAESIDLLVVSSHGKSGLKRWNTGSVVRKIVQNANRSILLVREDHAGEDVASARYQRVFVPLDGSARAECAFNSAIPLTRAQRAELVVGHVITRPEMPFQMELTDADRTLADQYAERTASVAKRYLDTLQQRHADRITTKVWVKNNVATALYDMIEEESIDLIVICAHGFSGDRNWPYGGIATVLIEYAPIPLLIIQDMAPVVPDAPLRDMQGSDA